MIFYGVKRKEKEHFLFLFSMGKARQIGVWVWMRCSGGAVYHLLSPWRNKTKSEEKEYSCVKRRIRFSHFILRSLSFSPLRWCLLTLCINCLASFSGFGMEAALGVRWKQLEISHSSSCERTASIHTNRSIWRRFLQLSFHKRALALSLSFLYILMSLSAVSLTSQGLFHSPGAKSLSHEELWRSMDIKSRFRIEWMVTVDCDNLLVWEESPFLEHCEVHSKHVWAFLFKGRRYDTPCAVCHPMASIKVPRKFIAPLYFLLESGRFLFFSIHREVYSFLSAFFSLFLRWDSDAQHKSRFKQKGVERRRHLSSSLCHVHQWLFRSSIQMSCFLFLLATLLITQRRR